MVELHNADIRARLKDIGGYIREEHLRGHPEKGRDWLTGARTNSGSPGGEDIDGH